MSELGPESNALVEEVMQKTREGFVIAKDLLWKDTAGIGRTEVDRTPQAEALAEALGAFAYQHLDDRDRIHELPLPATVEEAKAAYMGLVIAKKLDWAIYSQFTTQHAAEITGLLQDKWIKATALRRGIGVSRGGHGVSFGPGPREITAPFLGYKTNGAQLWLGEAEGVSYLVPLWEDNFQDKSAPIVQAATLEVH